MGKFEKKKADLRHKFSNCEVLVRSLKKWIADSNVEGFEGYDGHSNSILVSEWCGVGFPIQIGIVESRI